MQYRQWLCRNFSAGSANWRLRSGTRSTDRIRSDECSYRRPTANSGCWASPTCNPSSPTTSHRLAALEGRVEAAARLAGYADAGNARVGERQSNEAAAVARAARCGHRGARVSRRHQTLSRPAAASDPALAKVGQAIMAISGFQARGRDEGFPKAGIGESLHMARQRELAASTGGSPSIPAVRRVPGIASWKTPGARG